MADETTTTWANLMREAKGPLVEALKWKTVLLAEVQRDSNPRRWNGKQVTIPIFTAPQQGAGMINETGTSTIPRGELNAPQVHDDAQANVQNATIGVVVSFTRQVIQQAKGDENVWAEVIPTKMQRAEDAFKRVINEQMCGSGNALIAATTSGAGSPGLALPVGTTANFYQLYPGRIIDVLTRSNGADPGAGLIRKIASYDETAGTVTLSTTGFGGGSGNVTFSANEGIYIQGSYGNALAGVGQAVATTGTFQGINKATVDAWKGTDVSPAAVTDPTLSVFDKSERKAAQRSGETPDFYLCDPAIVDKFTQGLTVQARWAGEDGQLASGWTGVKYRNKVLIPEFDMPPQTAYGVSKNDMTIYSLMDGPDWDDLTGSMFQRSQSTRTLPVESWLIWMLQLGFTRCNTQVKIGNLTQAS